MDSAIVIAIVAAVGSAVAAYFASRSQRAQTSATAESEAQKRADARLDAAMDGERQSWERTEARLTRENAALSARVDYLEAELKSVTETSNARYALIAERLDLASTALSDSSGRVVQLTHAMIQAGIDVPAPRAF